MNETNRGISRCVFVCVCLCLLTANKWMSVHLSGIVVICIARRLRLLLLYEWNASQLVPLVPHCLRHCSTHSTVVQTTKRPTGKPTTQPNPTQPNPPLTSQPNSQAGKQSASHPCCPLLAVSSNQQPPPKWKAASQTGVEVPQSTAFCGRCNKFCFLDEDDDVNIALPHPICKFPSSLHFPSSYSIHIPNFIQIANDS